MLRPGARRTLWFRFGRDDGEVGESPRAVLASGLGTLRRRLPRARARRRSAPCARRRQAAQHGHAQPLPAYLRLLGVEPTASGALAVGRSGRFEGAVLRVTPRGHGRLRARRPVVVESGRDLVRGGPGTVRW